MMNEEKLNKMYQGFLENEFLTTKELNHYGLCSKDLATLIQEGRIGRLKRGVYSIGAMDGLYDYGQDLLEQRNYAQAYLCFRKCFEINPNHLGTRFQLFFSSIQERDYDKAFEYFEFLYHNDDPIDHKDYDYYLYLLSMITELPLKYRQYVKFLKLDDILVDTQDQRYEDIPAQNNIRFLSFKQRFTLARAKLDDLIEKNGKWTVQDLMIHALLAQARIEQVERKQTIAKLAHKKQYREMITYIEEFGQDHNLTAADQMILFLAKDLMEIMKTGILPLSKPVKTDNLFDAIYGRNYELAFHISQRYNQEHEILEEDNPTYLLLSEILKSQKSVVTRENNTMSLQTEQVIEDAVSSSYDNRVFYDIIGSFMKGELDYSFKTLKNYLESIDQKQYEFLIIDLIKISFIEKNMNFKKPMEVLTDLSQGKFQFDISEYIQSFVIALSQKHFDVAQIYLDIISKSNGLEQLSISLEGLKQVLSKLEVILNEGTKNEVLKKVEQLLQSDATLLENPQQYNLQNLESSLKVTSSKPISTEISDSDNRMLIHQKLENVYKNGIVVLKPMSAARRKQINHIVKEIPDVKLFTIGLEEPKRIVLKHSPYVSERIDTEAVFQEGQEAYRARNYEKCIQCYRQLLTFQHSRTIYMYLGFSYSYISQKKIALDYLTVALELSKTEKARRNVAKQIERLNGHTIPVEERKPVVKMSVNDFYNDLNKDYGIEQMDQIMELISSGMPIDEVCFNMGLTENQKNIVMLSLAKQCYAQENDILGDQYLKMVEQTKGKSKFVRSLSNEIRRDKKFYKYREEGVQKSLLFSPKIKK